MKFKSFFKKYRRRLSASYVTVATVFLFTVLLSFAVSKSALATKYKYSLQNSYVRAFTELTSNVDNIKHSLAKGVVTTDAREMSKLAGEIYSKSAAAGAALGQLPVSDVSLANTSKFLAQVGDFTNRLSLKYMDSGAITDEEYDTLLSFERYAENLSGSLSEMQAKLFGGELSFINDTGGSASSDMTALAGGFEEMENGFTDYPSLIYDGPFSDHIQNAAPALTEGLTEITPEEALKRITDMTGISMTLSGECGGNLPSYCFTGTCQSGAVANAEITKRGGILSWYLCDRPVYTPLITADDAKNAARSYIELCGLSNMRDTYYEIRNGIAVINFAAEENGVILYPDLVKVRVALDNGEIIGSELRGYIMNHKVRQIPSFSHSEAEILEKLSPKVTVSSLNKCLIPTAGKGEVFCYEIRCGFDNRDFLIYLNSETLRQEDILLLLVDENGTLTI